jgi:hypothetical protein
MFVLTGGADLLFIDTEHTYPQLHAELETHGDNERGDSPCTTRRPTATS